MAKVPQYNVPTVSPENISDIRGYANAQTFGAGVGQAVSGIGQSVSQVGDMLAANALKLQEQTNQADVDTAFVSWLPAQGELDTKLNSLQGKAREEYFPEYVRATEETRKKFHDSLANPDAQRRFNSETRRYAAYSIRNGAAAVATGLRQYHTRANERLGEAGLETVRANPTSDGAYDEGYNTAKRAIEQQGILNGDQPDSPETKDKVKKMESALVRARITSLARNDPAAAVELHKREDKKLNSEDRNAVETAIYSGQQKAGSGAELISQDMDRAMAGDLKQTAETGLSTPLTFDEVSKIKGPTAAKEWEQKRGNARKIWFSTKGLYNMTDTEMDFELNRIAPTKGTKDDPFDQQYARFKLIKEAMEKQKGLRNTDPALSVAKDPLVEDIIRNADAVTGGRDDQAWIELVGNARMAAQTRAGIPVDKRMPATNAELAPLIAPLKGPGMLPGSQAETLEKVAKSFQERYGADAKRVFSHALFADSYSAELRAAATNAMESLLSGVPGTPEQAAAIKRAKDNAAAKGALEPNPDTFLPVNTDPILSNPSYDSNSPVVYDEFGIPQTVPVPTKRGISPSKKLRQEMGPR